MLTEGKIKMLLDHIKILDHVERSCHHERKNRTFFLPRRDHKKIEPVAKMTASQHLHKTVLESIERIV